MCLSHFRVKLTTGVYVFTELEPKLDETFPMKQWMPKQTVSQMVGVYFYRGRVGLQYGFQFLSWFHIWGRWKPIQHLRLLETLVFGSAPEIDEGKCRIWIEIVPWSPKYTCTYARTEADTDFRICWHRELASAYLQDYIMHACIGFYVRFRPCPAKDLLGSGFESK